MGGTDIWEAGTDTDKTTGRLEANWKVKARIFCLQYFYISVTKCTYDVLEELLGFQILVEWKLRILGTVFYHQYCCLIQYFVTLNNIAVGVLKFVRKKSHFLLECLGENRCMSCE